MGRYVRFSITVREDQYERLRGVENRSQLLRNLIDAHFAARKVAESLEDRLASVETKIDFVLERFANSSAAKESSAVSGQLPQGGLRV